MSKTRKLHLSKSFDLYNLQYTHPKHKDLAVCFTYFNAAKSKRILMNYLYVVEKLKIAGIPYFTIEMYESVPEIQDAFHVKTDFILFQKERLCSILEKHIPTSYTKLMFIDADIVFDNLNWYDDMSEKLNDYNAVHAFTKFVRLDITYKHVIDECLSFTFRKKYGLAQKVGRSKIGFNPGGAWGFQRDWFRKIGFFEDDILGGSDTYSVQSWGIIPDTYVYPRFIEKSIQRYKNHIGTNFPSVSHLNGNVYHLWHGDTNKKQYRTRKNILRGIRNVKDIVKTSKDGLFQLKNNKLKRQFRNYFLNRDDDGLANEPEL
jgi:hypothetical protein